MISWTKLACIVPSFDFSTLSHYVNVKVKSKLYCMLGGLAGTRSAAYTDVKSAKHLLWNLHYQQVWFNWYHTVLLLFNFSLSYNQANTKHFSPHKLYHGMAYFISCHHLRFVPHHLFKRKFNSQKSTSEQRGHVV